MAAGSKTRVAVIMLAASIAGCSYVESVDEEVRSASTSDPILNEAKLCRTFGFRNWTLERNEDTVSVSGEASMPTPAWTIALHHDADAQSDGLVLIMETIEPSGVSNSVISWVSFETSVETSDAGGIDVSVTCADEVVWTAGDL